MIEDVSAGPYQAAAKDSFLKRLRPGDRPGGTSWHPEGAHARRRRGQYELLRAVDFEPGLLKELKTFGLAEEAGPWVMMASPLAALYRTTLAGEIGRERHLVPAEHRPISEVASLYQASHEAAADDEAGQLIDGYAFARSLPPFPSFEARPCANDSLLLAREKLADARRSFRRHVQSRVVAVAQLRSEDAIGSHLADFALEIQSETESQERGRRLFDIREAFRLIAIGGPAMAGIYAVSAGAPELVGAVASGASPLRTTSLRSNG